MTTERKVTDTEIPTKDMLSFLQGILDAYIKYEEELKKNLTNALDFHKVMTAMRECSLCLHNAIIDIQLNPLGWLEINKKEILKDVRAALGNVLREGCNAQKIYAKGINESVTESQQEEFNASLEKIFSCILQGLHYECYHPIAIRVDKSLREDHARIEKINFGLSEINLALFNIEKNLQDNDINSSAVNRLRKEFAQLLLCGTIHESDLKIVIEKIIYIIDVIHNKIPDNDIDKSCRIINRALAVLEENLMAWRSSTFAYLGSLALQTGGTIAAGAISVALPVVPSMSTAFTPQLGSIATPLVSATAEHVTPTAISSLSSHTSQVISSSSSVVRTPTESKNQHVAGKDYIKIGLQDLRLDTEYLWQELLLIEATKAWVKRNKTKIGIAGASAVIGAILSLSGAATPLGLALVAGGATTLTLANQAFEERNYQKIEKQVNKAMDDVMESIVERLELLELGEYRQNFKRYQQDTLAFINTALSNFQSPFSTFGAFVNSLSGGVDADSEVAENKEIIAQLKALKNELESEALGSFTQNLEDIDQTDSQSRVGYIKECVNKAREKVAYIEDKLKQLHKDGLIPMPPLTQALNRTSAELQTANQQLDQRIPRQGMALSLFDSKSIVFKELAPKIIEVEYQLRNIKAMYPDDYPFEVTLCTSHHNRK